MIIYIYMHILQGMCNPILRDFASSLVGFPILSGNRRVHLIDGMRFAAPSRSEVILAALHSARSPVQLDTLLDPKDSKRLVFR